MIFAPRSCPSRPGFAITTRIFLATPRSLRPSVSALDADERQRPLGALVEGPAFGRAVDLVLSPGDAQVDACDASLRQCLAGQTHEIGRRAQRMTPDVRRFTRAIGGCEAELG